MSGAEKPDTTPDVGAGVADLTRFNLVVIALLLCLCLVSLFYLIPVHVPLRAGVDQGLSARFMPRVATLSVITLSLLLLAEIVLRHLRGLGGIIEDNEDSEHQGFGTREISNGLLLGAGVAGYVALLNVSGFLIATAVFLGVCFRAGGMRNPIWYLLLCLVFPYALQQALWHGLQVILPSGVFGWFP